MALDDAMHHIVGLIAGDGNALTLMATSRIRRPTLTLTTSSGCIYRDEGFSLRLKRPRRNKTAQLRMQTVVDLFTRECLAIEVGQILKGADVVHPLSRIVATEVKIFEARTRCLADSVLA